MGFVTDASSCFLHSPLHHSLCFSTSSSSTCPFLFSFSPRHAVLNRRKKATAIACLNQENSTEKKLCKRRAAIFMGVALIPLLNFRAEAMEVFAAEDTESKTQYKKEESVHGNSSQSPFLSLLNATGLLGSGVLAALYLSEKKEKAIVDAAIESVNVKLKEKEDAITSLEKNFESELLNERDIRNKAMAKANEERQSLLNQLERTNGMITRLGQELEKEKRLVEERTLQVETLEVSLHKAGDEIREVQEQLKEKLDSIAALQERINLLSLEIREKEDTLLSVNYKLAEKERASSELASMYRHSLDQVSGLNSEIGELKDLILKKETELVLKNSTINNLNAELSSSLGEKDEYSKKLNALVKEYDHFKLTAEKKTASDAEILGEREEKLQQLEEQLKVALDNVKRNEAVISDLRSEKENLREMLEIELKNVKSLEHELKITKETLETLRNEASDLEKQLQNSRHLCSELEAEISKVRAEFDESRDMLQRNIQEAKQSADVLAGELISAKELLSKSKEELQVRSQELAAAVQNCDVLEKEVVDAHRKAESAAFDLNEEKKIVSSLNKELEVLETQMSKENQARKSLEADLEEATKSLDEMNRNALMRSRDLELANSRISSLEDEKELLYKSLDDQKQVSQEARENLEDAHNLVMRLGKERESLESRGKKLEEELASAKGEILRLRSQINSSRTPVVNDQYQQKVEVGSKSEVPPRRVTRRRKVTPEQEDS